MVNLPRPSWHRASDFTHVTPFSIPVCPTPEISPPKLDAVLLTPQPSAATAIRGSGVWQDTATRVSITTSQGYHVTAAKLADFGNKHLDGQVGAPGPADFYRILQEIDPLLLDKLPMPRQDFKIPLHRMRYILNILARDDRMLAQFKTAARQTAPGYARNIDAAQLEEELVLACASCFGGNASYILAHTLEEITKDSSYFPDGEGFIPREQAEALADLALEDQSIYNDLISKMRRERPRRTVEIDQIQGDKNHLVNFLLSAFNSRELRSLVPKEILYRMPDSFGIIPETFYTLSAHAIFGRNDPKIVSTILDRLIAKADWLERWMAQEFK